MSATPPRLPNAGPRVQTARAKWITRIAVVGGVIFVLVVGYVVIDTAVELLTGDDESEGKHYRTRADAKRADFQIQPLLPPTAFNIWQKCNYDWGTGIARFAFLTNEFSGLYTEMTPVTPARLAVVGPKWIKRPEPWIPKELAAGRTDRLLADGYSVFEYRLVSESGYPPLRGFIAIHDSWKQAVLWYWGTESHP